MSIMIRKLVRILLLWAVLICSVSCNRNPQPGQPVSHLVHQDWSVDVRNGLNCFMDDCAGMQNAYVVFDFDNTTSIFDVEEQLAIYQLETMSFALGPEQFPKVLATGLGDAPAEWASVDDSYNWILYWFCGMTEKEVYDMAYASHKKYSAVNTSIETWSSPSELISSVGQVSVSWTKGVQVSENGLRSFRSSNKTLRYGSDEERLFANQDNEEQLAEAPDKFFANRSRII